MLDSPRLCILDSMASTVAAMAISRPDDVNVVGPIPPSDSKFWKLSK